MNIVHLVRVKIVPNRSLSGNNSWYLFGGSDLEQHYYILFNIKTQKEKFSGNFIFGELNHQKNVFSQKPWKILIFEFLTTSFWAQ